jgi:hypothetical protein
MFEKRASLSEGPKDRAAAGLRHRRRLCRKAGVIRNPLDNLVASCEQNVTAFRQKGGDMPTLLRSSETNGCGATISRLSGRARTCAFRMRFFFSDVLNSHTTWRLRAFKMPMSAYWVRAQRVDATQALNLSAGVSNCKVSRGRSFS